jgi:hypothetical protein
MKYESKKRRGESTCFISLQSSRFVRKSTTGSPSLDEIVFVNLDGILGRAPFDG